LKFHGYAVIEDNLTFERSFFLFFDLVSDSLASIIKKKRSSKIRFHFQEIYSTYRALLNSFTYSQMRNIRHSKICPQNIMCESEEEEIYFSSIRICDFAVGEEKQNKSKLSFGKDLPDSEIKYLSPELRNHDLKEGADYYKADVFALGILILEMGTFKFPSNLEYKEDEFIFVETKDLAIELEEMMKEMKLIYKERIRPVDRKKFEFFMNLLELMLSLEITSRPDFLELYKRSIFMCDEDILNHMMIEEKRYSMEGEVFWIDKN